MVHHVAHLVRLHQRTGKIIALALEPEPCCFIETIAEAVAFFRDHLFASAAIEQLMSETGLDKSAAEAALHQHIGICLDLCHAAVEFEDPAGCVEAVRSAGIAIPKVQLSAGLRIPHVTPEAIEQIRPFNDDVYLHQVVEQIESRLNRYVDLPPAMSAFDESGPAREWRVHFHVPIFLAEMHAFATTRNFLEQVLAVHRSAPISRHLEVETYTFDVLPAEFRTTDVVTNIVRELEWAKEQLER